MNKLINILTLRLKLIYRDKATLTLAIIITIVMGLVIHNLYENVEISSKIPIVVVDEDNSTLSDKISNNLDNNDLLRVIKTNENKGIRMLKNGDVEAVFLLNKGIEDKIWDLDLDKIIKVYYISGNYMPLVLSDLIASELLTEISIITAVNYLDKALDNVRNKDEILKEAYLYGETLSKETKENYYVDVEFVNLTNEEKINAENIDNDLALKRIILGIILSFITLYILFSTINIVKDREIGIAKKVEISITNNHSIIIGEYLSIVISALSVCIVFSLFISYYSNSFTITFIKVIVVLILFVMSYSSFMLFFASLFQRVTSFVVVGTATIIILGIISGSFFNIDMRSEAINYIASLIPTYHTLSELMNIIVNSDFINIMYYFRYMFIYSLAFLLLTYINIVKTNKLRIE